jgi:hypothetical protein
MRPESQAQQNKRPWLALLAATFLLLAIPAGRFAASRFAPAEDLTGYGGLAAGLAGICSALLAGLVLAALSLLRRESPRLLSAVMLLISGIALAWLFLHVPG